ncbi:acyl-CoA dehydrogenase [Caballeronia calidae]|uniref:Acyl-CoA dehydrogenase n=1 Tax=Caballeronia calidae TaxID=1777139 RepID=A0A158E4P5_9BURK|nr:acyl-CoA dehydrogenase family protein [Caballeronia calidae]SAL01700.1 acyl-CoA dehydrogenase [Caballeronia calidae]
MDFTLTHEQRMMVDTTRRLNEEVLQPILDAHPCHRSLPKAATKEVLQHLAQLGLTAARLPEFAGGPGLSALDYGLMCEQLSPTVAFILLPHETTITRLHHGCSEIQRERWMRELISAERIICTAATEPDTGSDPRGVRARIRRQAGRLVLNGQKMWISNGSVADLVNVTCLDEQGVLVRVIVDRQQSAFEVKEIPMMGLQQCHLSELSFADCCIPFDNLIEGTGDAAKVLTLTWLANRPIIGLSAVSLAQRAFEAAQEYAMTRRQFGREIGKFQLIQQQLADIETEISASRLLCYSALAAIDRGERANGVSAMAKRFAVSACERAIALSMQVHGSMGLSQELGLEQMARDVRMLSIPDGTPEILTLIQGREITSYDAFRA